MDTGDVLIVISAHDMSLSSYARSAALPDDICGSSARASAHAARE